MNRKLVIQFWKAERTLAMQVLKQEGLPDCKEDGLVKIDDCPWIGMKGIVLRGSASSLDLRIPYGYFDSNTERDDYLQKMVNAITDELFTNKDELKVGELCEVSDYNNVWYTHKLLAILPKHCDARFIVEFLGGEWTAYEHARPIVKRTEPKVEECGQLVTYIWED